MKNRYQCEFQPVIQSLTDIFSVIRRVTQWLAQHFGARGHDLGSSQHYFQNYNYTYRSYITRVCEMWSQRLLLQIWNYWQRQWSYFIYIEIQIKSQPTVLSFKVGSNRKHNSHLLYFGVISRRQIQHLFKAFIVSGRISQFMWTLKLLWRNDAHWTRQMLYLCYSHLHTAILAS